MAAVCGSFSAAEHRAHRMLHLHPADCNAGLVEMARILRGMEQSHGASCKVGKRGKLRRRLPVDLT